MNNIKKILFFICPLFISFFSYELVFALEVAWPVIPGAPVITETSKIGDFTAYSYALFVVIGSFAAVMVLISAGIDFLTSHDIAKIKTKIAGSIIGLFVLIVPYSLFIALNPDILKPATEILSCEKTGVCVVRKIKTTITTTQDIDGSTKSETKTEEKDLEESSIQSMPKINELSISEANDGKSIQRIEKKQEITIKKFNGLQALIAFSQEDYKGSAIVLFADSPDNDNLNSPLPGEITISGDKYKSIKVVPKTAGVFFYDTSNYGVSSDAPFPSSIGIRSLKGKTINSIDIVEPQKQEGIDYIGLLFDKDDYRIKCGPFYNDVPDVVNDALIKDSLPSSAEGSVKIYKRDRNKLSGSKIVLTFFNNTSCASRSSVEDDDTKKVKWNENRKCEITLIGNDNEIPLKSSSSGLSPTCTDDNYECKVTLASVDTIASPQIINDACPNFEGNVSNLGMGEDVLSFRIDSAATVVLLDNYKFCNSWDLQRIAQGEGDCNQVNSGGLNPSALFRPKKFFIIPY